MNDHSIEFPEKNMEVKVDSVERFLKVFEDLVKENKRFRDENECLKRIINSFQFTTEEHEKLIDWAKRFYPHLFMGY